MDEENFLESFVLSDLEQEVEQSNRIPPPPPVDVAVANVGGNSLPALTVDAANC